jgi:V/A-type H+-transporting ATPase subunit E
MNGIEKIIGRLDSDTQSEIDGILAAAREKADGITAGYQAQAGKLNEQLTAQYEKAAAQRRERLVSAAQMEARKEALAVRQEMVDEAFRLALEKLSSLPEAEYTETVAKLLSQAAPDGKGEAVFDPADRDRIGAAAVARANELLHGGALTLSEETRPIGSGVILKRQRVEVNCAFSTLVRLRRAECSGQAARRLFPEE